MTLCLPRFGDYDEIEVSFDYEPSTGHVQDSQGGTLEAPEGSGVTNLEILGCESGWTFLLHDLKDPKFRERFESRVMWEYETQLEEEGR